MSREDIPRHLGGGWLALLGGGEFSYGETEDADAAWLSKFEQGTVGFIPAASGSQDYGRHFVTYMDEAFERRSEVIPVYRARDAKRGKNAERIAGCEALYLGGGLADHLLSALQDTPAQEALLNRLRDGGVVAATASSAQCLGLWIRDLRGGIQHGLGWLPGGVVEANFGPAHDRRLRQLMGQAGVRWGLGLPAGSALLLGPEGELETVGLVFLLSDAEGDLQPWGEE